MQWWLQIGTNLDRESVRVRPQNGLTRHLQGIAMPAKTTAKKPKPKKSKASEPPANGTSTISIAIKNLLNMVVVLAASGTVLLGLLAAKHF
jgi:hypothetical protein